MFTVRFIHLLSHGQLVIMERVQRYISKWAVEKYHGKMETWVIG